MRKLIVERGEVLKRLDSMLDRAAKKYAEVQPAMRNNRVVFSQKTQWFEFSDQPAVDEAFRATEQLIFTAAARAAMSDKDWDVVAQEAVAAIDPTVAREGIFSGRRINTEKELAELALSLKTTAIFDAEELPLDFPTLVANEALVLGAEIPVDVSIQD